MFNLTEIPMLDCLLNDLLEIEEQDSILAPDFFNPSLDDYLSYFDDYNHPLE